MIKKVKKVPAGINIRVSQEAHKKMREEGYIATPRRNLRQQINFINKLPIEL